MFERRTGGIPRQSDRNQSASVALPTQGPDLLDLEDDRFLAALRRGDETAFARLFRCYHNSMVEVARVYLPDAGIAEEVAQETWLGVVDGLKRFDCRSSLKSWIFTILRNRAKTRYARDCSKRLLQPFSDDEQFGGSNEPPRVVGWPSSWGDTPEQELLSKEARAHLRQAIASLPSTRQREVLTLRDLEGLPSHEVCNILGITMENQRVLLHRARNRVKLALDRYFEVSRARVR